MSSGGITTAAGAKPEPAVVSRTDGGGVAEETECSDGQVGESQTFGVSSEPTQTLPSSVPKRRKSSLFQAPRGALDRDIQRTLARIEDGDDDDDDNEEEEEFDDDDFDGDSDSAGEDSNLLVPTGAPPAPPIPVDSQKIEGSALYSRQPRNTKKFIMGALQNRSSSVRTGIIKKASSFRTDKRRDTLLGLAGLKNDKKQISEAKSTRRLKRWILRLQLAATIYATLVVLPSSTGIGVAEYSSSGDIVLCPRFTICSENWRDVIFLLFSRLSAYWMFPHLVLIFFTKSYKVIQKLEVSVVSIYIPMEDLHDIHTSSGYQIAAMAVVHTAFHIIRWIVRSEAMLIVDNDCSRSGLIAFLLMAPVVALMGIEKLRKKYPWEIRKTAHFLAIPAALALCWHTKLLSTIIGATVSLYLVDSVFRLAYDTHRIDMSVFTRLGSGTQLTFKNPKSWGDKGAHGYINVLVPWISKKEWHPFSIYPHPTLPNHSCVFMMAIGDWTKKLHNAVLRNSARPVWVNGPVPSPYEAAVNFDNLLLCASGIGITPALGCIENYRNSNRSVSLIWMVRDNSLVEFFLEHTKFPSDGITLIYYTGKAALDLSKKPEKVRIIPGRPKLETTIIDIIHCVELAKELPEEIDSKADAFMEDMNGIYDGIAAEEKAIDSFLLVLRRCVKRGMTAEDIESTFFPRLTEEEIETRRKKAEEERLKNTSKTKLEAREGAVSSTSTLPSSRIRDRRSGGGRLGSIFMRKESGVELAALRASYVDETTSEISAVEFMQRIISLAGKSYLPTAMDVTDILMEICEYGSTDEKREVLDPKWRLTKPKLIAFLDKNVFLQSADDKKDLLSMVELITSEESLKQKFEEMDTKKTGFLSISDLASLSIRLSEGASREDIVASFQAIDANTDGKISFEEFFNWWKERRDKRKRETLSHSIDVKADSRTAPERVLDPEMAKRWGLMYCGGAAPVEKTVREVGMRQNIEFKIESFAW